jgi:hypothetical protein
MITKNGSGEDVEIHNNFQLKLPEKTSTNEEGA